MVQMQPLYPAEIILYLQHLMMHGGLLQMALQIIQFHGGKEQRKLVLLVLLMSALQLQPHIRHK